MSESTVDGVGRYPSGGPWEDRYGYSRVVTAAGWALVSGCTSTVDGQVTHVGDAGAQAGQALEIGLAALAGVGQGAADVVRTRMYVCRREDADAVGAAHAAAFGAAPPATTMVMVAGLLHPDHLVEIELDAYRAVQE